MVAGACLVWASLEQRGSAAAHPSSRAAARGCLFGVQDGRCRGLGRCRCRFFPVSSTSAWSERQPKTGRVSMHPRRRPHFVQPDHEHAAWLGAAIAAFQSGLADGCVRKVEATSADSPHRPNRPDRGSQQRTRGQLSSSRRGSSTRSRGPSCGGGGGSWGQSDLHPARDRKVSWRGSRGDVLGSMSPPNCRYMEMRPVAPHIWCPDPILSALARRQRPVALSR